MRPFSVLSNAGIKHLAQHKHVNYEYTPMDHLHEPLWVFCARHTPAWLSPNAISLSGGLSGVLSAVCAVAGTILGNQGLQIFAGFFIFIYMTADAVDGKHARATNQATPMGALVDHGVDAAIAFTTGLAICVTVGWQRLELNMDLMMPYCAFHSVWFVAQWAERQLGYLDTRGITEGELASIVVLALPGFVPGVYQKMVHLPSVFGWEQPVSMDTIVSYGVLVWAGSTAIYQFLVVLYKRKASNWMPLVHFMVHNIVSVWLSTAPAYSRTSLTRLLNFTIVGMNACQLMTKIRFTTSTHSPWQAEQLDLIPFLILSAAQIVGVDMSVQCLMAVLLWQLLSLILVWFDTISRLCAAFHLPFLARVPEGWKVPAASVLGNDVSPRGSHFVALAVGAACALCLSACATVW